jgi:hypothetical protein
LIEYNCHLRNSAIALIHDKPSLIVFLQTAQDAAPYGAILAQAVLFDRG